MTQIWFESPRRCAQTLKLFAEIQGNRKIAISRELTKLYEQVERGTLAELASHYAEQEPPKGEMVLVIEGCATDKKMDEDEILSLLTEKLNQLSLRDAVREVEGLSGRRHKEIISLRFRSGRKNHKYSASSDQTASHQKTSQKPSANRQSVSEKKQRAERAGHLAEWAVLLAYLCCGY